MNNSNRDSDERKLFSTNSEVEANLISDILNKYGIPNFLKSESFGKVAGITINGLGQIDIYVRSEDYELAMDVLKNRIDKGKKDSEV